MGASSYYSHSNFLHIIAQIAKIVKSLNFILRETVRKTNFLSISNNCKRLHLGIFPSPLFLFQQCAVQIQFCAKCKDEPAPTFPSEDMALYNCQRSKKATHRVAMHWMRDSIMLWYRPVFEGANETVHWTVSFKWVRIPMQMPKKDHPMGSTASVEDEGFDYVMVSTSF